MSGRTSTQICIDCTDPTPLVPFWAAAMDYEAGDDEVRDPTGSGPVIWFQRVPERKTVKNRLHLDIWFADEDAAVTRRDDLIQLGGTAVREAHDFWLMHDPEGNEFCLCWPFKDGAN